MSIVQWLLLVLVIAVVAGAYWYLRRQSASDPWQGMEDEDADPSAADGSGVDRGESLGGDSYIVGVRTLSKSTPESRKAAHAQDPTPPDAPVDVEVNDDTAEASWQAYKSAPPETDAARDAGPAEHEREAAAAAPPRRERAFGEPAADDRPEKADPHRVDDIRGPRAAPEDQQIFILHVASPDGRFFLGPDVHAALKQQQLKFGLNDIYHRVTETNGVPESVFSVANMLKPGTLDPVDEDHLQTPGLTLFLVLPGPLDGVASMRDMMETANGIAVALGGEVLDDKRALLKAQTAQYMLDQIAEIDRRARIAQRR